MSPEQARGRSVDKRTDIWSFGAILYEMLVGASPFAGESAHDSIGAVLHKDVDLTRLPPGAPPILRHVLARCLARDKRRRYRDIGDVRIDLELAAVGEPAVDAAAAPPAGRRARGVPSSYAGLGFVALVAMAAGALLFSLLDGPAGTPEPPTAAPVLFEVPPVVDGEPFGVDDLAIAPDGSAIVIAPIGGGPLFVRDLGGVDLRPLAGTEGADWPFFSPDGRWIAFTAPDGQLLRIPTEGGLPLKVGEALEYGAWVDERTILQCTEDERSIQRLDLDTGGAELLATVPSDRGLLGLDTLCLVPGRDYVLAGAYTGNSIDAYTIVAVSLDDGAIEEVMPNASSPMIASGEELVFLRDSTLFAVAFDVESARVTGPERRVLDGVTASQWGGQANASLSRTGTLVYLPGDRISEGRRVVRVSMTGQTEPVTDPDAFEERTLAVSPDGSRLVVSTLRRALESWIYDLERGSLQRISGEGEAYSFCWSPDGARLAYTVQRPERGYELADIVIRDVGSGGSPRVIASHADVHSMQWLPDGSGLVLLQPSARSDGSRHDRLHALSLEDPDTLKPLFEQDGQSITGVKISPDGRRIAYISDRSGQAEVYVRRYPQLDRTRQVSFSPSNMLNWSPAGDTIYWTEAGGMMKAAVSETEDDGLSVGAPVAMFPSPWPRSWTRWESWVMAPDGTFLAIAPAEWEQRQSPPRVIVGFPRDR
jgi:serine/threonine-protein kinase